MIWKCKSILIKRALYCVCMGKIEGIPSGSAVFQMELIGRVTPRQKTWETADNALWANALYGRAGARSSRVMRSRRSVTLPLRFRVVFHVVHVADGVSIGVGDEAKPVVAMP